MSTRTQRVPRVLLSLLFAAGAVPALAQELTWDALQKEQRVAAGTVLPPEPGSSFHRLRIDGTGQATAVTVLTIEQPPVQGPRYAITGQVRYDAVEGTGYLELWNYFPGGGQYFSRTLGDAGPMMKLQGSSGWRSFALPFDATGAPPPTRLVVNVVLPGRGAVYLGPLQFVASPSLDVAGATERTLDRTMGQLGGIAGGVVGSIGALIGVLTSLGRGRRFVDLTAKALVVAGTASFIGGLVAVARSQPYALYYPLLLGGFIAAVIPLGLLPSIRKRYQDIELRRMRAHDLG